LVLGSEEGSELATAFLKVGLVLRSQLFKTALAHLLNDNLVGLVFPLSSKGKILVTVDVTKVLLKLLKRIIGTDRTVYLRTLVHDGHGCEHLP
jgi:hypothetical protein